MRVTLPLALIMLSMKMMNEKSVTDFVDKVSDRF